MADALLMYMMVGAPMGVLGVLVFVLDIIAIVSLLGGGASIEHKIIWILVILILPVLGMVLYFLIGRSSRDA